jgi:hypothetical protein
VQGWIKLHRQLIDSDVWQDARLLQTWVWCLLSASHAQARFRWNGIDEELRPGQFIAGTIKGAMECNIPHTSFRRRLDRLVELGNISVQSCSKFSRITVNNWGTFQDKAAIKPAFKPAINNTDETLENIDANECDMEKSAIKPVTFKKEERRNNDSTNDTNGNDETIDSTGIEHLNLKAVPAATVGTLELLSYFAQCHEQRTGAPYMINYGKEGAAFKAMLAIYGPDKLKDIINAFFQSKDEFIHKAGFTVGVMRSQINKLAASLAAPKARTAPVGMTSAQLFHFEKKKAEAAV